MLSLKKMLKVPEGLNPYDIFLAICLLISALLVPVAYRYYLYTNTNNIADNFKTQNFQEIESGNIFELTSRLNALSASLNWVCLSAQNYGNLFFYRENGQCGDAFFQKHVSIVSENNKGINIELTLKLPQVLEIAFVVIMLLQILSLGLIYWGGKKAENFRLQKELAIAQLSLQVAHDIRSPLASLESGLKDIDIPEDNAALIKQSTERIRAIADDLLRKYRRNPKVDNLEGKKEEDIKYTEKTCDLTEIIKKIILEKKAVYKDIEFKVDTPNEKIEIKTDANEISRMVSNLINNSVEAMAGDKSQIRVYNQVNKKITIRLRKEEDKAVIIIKDNGKGISKEIINRLGEKGFSVGKENGNGLGLWHAKTLTESLGGSLEISSETNLGTEIRIILPVLTTNSIIPVVLIDDDPLVRKNWEIKARKNGINLKTYANPIDFIKTSHNYPKETQIYLDSELGNDIKGEEIAKELYEKGFKNIYIETGYSKDKFKDNKYIKEMISKEPPF